MPIIRIPGSKPAAKPAPPAKKAAAKPAAKKPAAKVVPPAKKKAAAAKKPVAKKAKRTVAAAPAAPQRVAADGRVLRVPKDLDPQTLENYESALAEAGTRVKEAKVEHDAAIEAVHEVVVQAQDVGIPMAIIEDVTGISRQWLYKMSQFKGRTPSNGVQPAPAKKAAAAKKPAAKKTAAKKVASPAKRAAAVATQTAKRSGSTVIRIA